MEFWHHLILYSIAPALGWIGKKLWDRWDEKRKAKEVENNSWHYKFSSYHDISLMLKKALRDTESSRVLLLKCTNGGEVPRIDSTLYSSIIMEEFDDEKTSSIYDEWQDRKLDKHYTEVLIDLDTKKSSVLKVSDCPEGSLLANLYMSKGIVGSRLFRIASTPEKYFYLVANYVTKIDDDDPSSNHVFSLVVDSLQKIFAEYPFSD